MNHPMTLAGKQLLESELHKLIKVDREEVKLALTEARAHGDLKENAEYSAAKEKQSIVEGRILEIQSKLAHAQAIDPTRTKGDRIVFGATVTIYDHEKNQSQTLQIVGEDEAKLSHEKISYNSPIAKALIGKQESDEVIVKAPKGDKHYEVEKIEFK